MPIVYKDIFSNVNELGKYDGVRCNLIIDKFCGLEPDLSIMIPTYSRVELLKQSIDSVLLQTNKVNFELVIVDNNPDEDYAKKVDSLIDSYQFHNIRLFRNEKNIGMFGNWNRCFNIARGPWVSILNDDDLLDRDFLKDIWPLRDEERIVFCGFTQFTGLNKPTIERENGLHTSALVTSSLVSESSIMSACPIPGTLGALIPKKLAVTLGGFNENNWPSADYHFIFRAWLHSGLRKINIKRAYYRWGVNESLSVKTLSGFLREDLELRYAYINRLSYGFFKKKILRWIALYHVKILAHVVYPKVNSEFNAETCLSSLSLNVKKPAFSRFISGRVTRLWLILKFF